MASTRATKSGVNKDIQDKVRTTTSTTTSTTSAVLVVLVSTDYS